MTRPRGITPLPRALRSCALAALCSLPAAAEAQEYQVGVAYTAVSTSHRWHGVAGAPAPTLLPDRSGSAPSLVGNLQFPLLTVSDFTATGDFGLRWPFGGDIGMIEWGAGVSRATARGYLSLHWTWHSGGSEEVLGQNWGVYTEGPRAIVRHGPFRADLTRMVKRYPRDDLTYSKLGLAVRYRIVGVELERWRESAGSASGVHHDDLNRVSFFLAIGQWEDRRGR